MKKRALLLCCIAPAAARADVPYAKLVDTQVFFQSLPPAQRDKLVMRLLVQHGDKDNHDPIHIWVMDGGKRVDIPLGPDGAMPEAIRQDWIARDLVVMGEHPKGGLRTEIELLIRAPSGQQIPAAYLRDGIEQAQTAFTAGARHLGGYLATLAVPTLRLARVKLATCCTGMATVAGTVIPQEKDGAVPVTLSVLKDHPDATVVLSAPVIAIDPTDE
jgi:hypothetical protein